MNENTAATSEGLNTGTQNSVTDTNNQKGQKQNSAFTQSDVDRRVTEALKTAHEKWEKELNSRIEQERADAEKLAKMSAEERARAEAQKAQKLFEQERAQYRRDKLEFEVTKKLAEKKIPVGFAKYISALDLGETDDHVKSLENLLGEYRQSVVNELTKGTAPKLGTVQTEQDPFLRGFGK